MIINNISSLAWVPEMAKSKVVSAIKALQKGAVAGAKSFEFKAKRIDLEELVKVFTPTQETVVLPNIESLQDLEKLSWDAIASFEQEIVDQMVQKFSAEELYQRYSELYRQLDAAIVRQEQIQKTLSDTQWDALFDYQWERSILLDEESLTIDWLSAENAQLRELVELAGPKSFDWQGQLVKKWLPQWHWAGHPHPEPPWVEKLVGDPGEWRLWAQYLKETKFLGLEDYWARVPAMQLANAMKADGHALKLAYNELYGQPLIAKLSPRQREWIRLDELIQGTGQRQNWLLVDALRDHVDGAQFLDEYDWPLSSL